MKQFQINREDTSRTRVVETPTPEPIAGEIVVRIEHFGLTANNVTYSVLGDSFGYWSFFPARGEDAGQWGVLPVWGYAEVVASEAADVAVGERLFGFFPTASHLVMRPEGRAEHPVVDVAPHRTELPSGYNRYYRVAPVTEDEERTREDLRMLLYPLYLTSWAIADMLEEESWFGADQVLLASASSKTALGVAYAVRAAENPPTLVGLTSAGNRAWVEGLDLYDRVVVYDDVETEIGSEPTVIVDMAGNGPLLGRLHTHLGDAMRRTVSVGITHWEDFGAHGDVIGERTEFFFAPTVIAKRAKEWGFAQFTLRTETFMRDASSSSTSWLSVEETRGLEDLPALFEAARAGSIGPSVGPVVRL